MGGKQRQIRVVATHRFVRDPEAVERALETWARYLAQRVALPGEGREGGGPAEGTE